MGKGKKTKGMGAYAADGFRAVVELDNSNVYAVMISEMVSNIFKEGMWFKALTPYMLIITDNDPISVGNMLTLNGVTRALVGVSSGRLLINNIGIDAVWIATGIAGFLGILVNVICLCQGSVFAAYVLNFTWAVYNGLWNSCLETSWARSIFRNKREDINGARQITNKFTTSLGPLFSAAIFVAYGNKWDVGLVQNVMLFGTGMTSAVVALCFCFRASEEIEQDLPLQDVRSMEFSTAVNLALDKPKIFMPESMSQSDFIANDDGNVVLTCPLGGNSDSWASRIRILTSDYAETNFILAKQFRASLHGIHTRSCVLHFHDDSRHSVPVQLEEVKVYLTQAEENSEDVPKVNISRSTVRFSMDLDSVRSPQYFSFGRFLRVILFGSNKEILLQGNQKPLLGGQSEGVDDQLPVKGKTATDILVHNTTTPTRAPNMLGANVIVVCDVLNALGAGFSLKFIDLFLKVDYGVSPAGVFMVAFLQNILGAWLTPFAKKLLAGLKQEGYRAKLGVVFLWSLALLFLGLVCMPGMPLWVVIPSIVLMQSLNSCTKAFNRAQLINFLPREKIATYMTWDAMNKANQGGIAIFGAQVVAAAGYRGCFVGTFIILFIRMLIYLTFTLRKGTIYRGGYLRALEAQQLSEAAQPESSPTNDDLTSVENIKGYDDTDQESQMFQPAEALALASRKPAVREEGQLLELSPARLLSDVWEERPLSRRGSKL